MTALLNELKVRARLRLNADKGSQPQLRLRDCLNQVSREVGFSNWEQGRKVLGGEARPGADWGRFWHAPLCNSLLNEWFADYGTAASALASTPDCVLLPYRRQFVLASAPFVRELSLDEGDPAWTAAGRDLVGSYGSDPWLRLALQRLKAPKAAFALR